jgi:NAD-dependent SIR2 family protein deacetylase
MQHTQFMNEDHSRRRYWARSMVGYQTVWHTKPNIGHDAVTYGQQHHPHRVKHIITQNVDGLQQLSGASNVIELHGTIHKVRWLLRQV